MGVSVRSVAEPDLPALLAIHRAQNDFGGAWFTNPYAGGKAARYEDLTPAQRWLHGGAWMDPQLLALHVQRYRDAGGTILVAERDGALVGAAELWPAEEPLPLGSYLCVEMLITDPPDDAVVERALLDVAVRETRGRDLRALDIAPLHAGGSVDRLTREGFSVLIEMRTLHIDPAHRPRPPEHAVRSTAPTFAEFRDFVALDHREPPSFRIGSLGNEWAGGLLSNVSHAFGGLLRVDFADLGLTGRVCTWLPEREAEVDLWVSTRSLGNGPWFRRAVSAGLDYVAKHHRVSLVRTTVSSHLVPALRDLGWEDGTEPDPWLRRHLLLRNL